MASIGKRYKTLSEKVDRLRKYSLKEAVGLIKETATAKFDESVDIVIGLGVDVKQSDQIVRGVVALPHGTGKIARIAVFARDAKAEEAKAAGADIVGTDDLVENILKGEINFDRCIATPDMMGLVGRVAKVLGPKGLMPNPKLGTVTMNIAQAVSLAKAGQVEFRAEKAGIVHAGLGKVSFSAAQLEENIQTFVDAIMKAKPAGAKGVYMKSIGLSSTMGVGIKLDLTTVGSRP